MIKKYFILRAHMMQWHQVPSDNIEGRIEQEVSEETVITNQNTGFFASEQSVSCIRTDICYISERKDLNKFRNNGLKKFPIHLQRNFIIWCMVNFGPLHCIIQKNINRLRRNDNLGLKKGLP